MQNSFCRHTSVVQVPFSLTYRYGPREVARREDFSMKGQIACEVKFAPFSCRVRRQHVQDMQEKDFSTQLLEALEPAVRLVSIIIMIIMKYLLSVNL